MDKLILDLLLSILISNNVCHGLVFKIFYNRVIHPCVLCLCLQNYGWWVFNECPILTKTRMQTLNHIMVR